MGLRIGPLLGWGIVIYSVMYLLSTVLVTYGFFGGIMPRVVSLAVLVAVSILACGSLKMHTWRDILPYSLSWAAIVAVIDGILLVPLGGFSVYANASVWFGYALVALAPLLALYPRFNRLTPSR